MGGTFVPSVQSQEIPGDNEVAARVGNHVITAHTVDRFVNLKLSKQELPKDQRAILRAHSLEHLVRRAVVYHYLLAKGRWAEPTAVKFDIEQFEQQLARAEVTLQQHLDKKNIDRKQFEFETAWKLSWKNYLTKTLTDANLAKYFDSQRRKFDGTQLKVAHLLIKDPSEAARQKLVQIRKQLDENSLQWIQLVGKHSDAPSKDNGGEIGWISANGPMPPEFTEAAFQLEVGRLSQPVQTGIGWHLIKCLEVKPGKKGPLDTRPELIASAREFLFYKLAKDHRDKIAIEYSPQFPHLDSNGELVMPK